MMSRMEVTEGELLRQRYLRNRARTRALFEAVAPAAYEWRPISLRNPICFYDGHIPAFAANTLLKSALGEAPVEASLDALFARGIDPEDEESVPATPGWPSREAIVDYGRRVDARVLEALANADPGTAAGRTILEHEEMHQETLCYLLHQLPGAMKTAPPRTAPTRTDDGAAIPARAPIRAGIATLGLDPSRGDFGWDNEFPRHEVAVPAFEIDLHDVTNIEFMEFVDAGGYERPELWSPRAFEWVRKNRIRHPWFWSRQDDAWLWRGIFQYVPLPSSWPVFVTHAEASAYAVWKGARLPTEAEYHRAAFGTPEGTEREHPWGDAPPDATRGNFGFRSFDPMPVGSFPAGRSAFGVHDLVGNGWEWTSTPFAPFPGFRPMPAYPAYSADFFDGRHWVLKGASPVTVSSLTRRTFRNWFRGTYPYVYAAFRCVWSRASAR
jgi:iron(II)-dependent oxidoreductase